MKKKWIIIGVCAIVLASVLMVLKCTVFTGQQNPLNAQLQYPTRIVSLSPASTEILFAIGAGDQIVARTDFCNYPQDTQNIASIGGFDGKTFSLETILSFSPDLVYLNTTMHGHLVQSLGELGIAVFQTESSSLQDIYSEILEAGTITGHAKESEKIVKTMEKAITYENTNTPVTVYWEVWNAPYMSVGNTSFIHDVIQTSGAQNIFSDIETGYPVVSEESIIARNPDVIFLPSDSPETIETIRKRTGWNSINAVKNGKIYKIDGDIISRPGPRVVDAIEKIRSCLDQ